MISTVTRMVVGGLAFAAAATTRAAESESEANACRERVQVVTGLRGCVAFWDFVQREPDGQQRFIAHVPPGATNDFPLDAAMSRKTGQVRFSTNTPCTNATPPRNRPPCLPIRPPRCWTPRGSASP